MFVDNDTVGRIHSAWRDRSRVEEEDFVKLDMFFALLNEMRMMLMNQWSQSFRLPFVAPQYSWIKILEKWIAFLRLLTFDGRVRPNALFPFYEI